jgi:hypothetical protein
MPRRNRYIRLTTEQEVAVFSKERVLGVHTGNSKHSKSAIAEKEIINNK